MLEHSSPKRLYFLLLTSLSFMGIQLVHAQDVQPRIYAPAPTGINVLTFGYSYSSGAMLFDRTIPIENVEASIHSFSAAYSRSTALFGMAGRFDVAVPVVEGKWIGEVLEERQSTSRFGVGDPIIRYTLFVLGAPAISKEKFKDFDPKTIVGMTMRITLPLGEYDSSKIINLGSNRWVFSPQIGVWHRWHQFSLEGHAGLWFFTTNKNFFGNQERSQEPLITFQLHASYEFKNGIWIAVSTRQSLGGEVRVDNENPLDPESNNRIGFTLTVPLGSQYIVKLLATTGITTTVGNDYDTLGIAWQVVF